MAYEIHIERVDDDGEPASSPITLADWKAAIERVEGVRLASDDAVATNPSTGEITRIPNAGGDAEVFFPAQSAWSRVYRWHKGRISFKGLPSFDESDDVVRRTTNLLATVLEARIIGDGGEFYG